VVDVLLKAGAKMTFSIGSPSKLRLPASKGFFSEEKIQAHPSLARTKPKLKTRTRLNTEPARIRRISNATTSNLISKPMPPPRKGDAAPPPSSRPKYSRGESGKKTPKGYGFSALHLAVTGSHYKTAAVLLSHARAQYNDLVNTLSAKTELSALHLAVGSEDVRMTHLLLRAKADPCIRPQSCGVTALDMVVSGAAWDNAGPSRQRIQIALINAIVHHGRLRGESDIVEYCLGARTPLWLAAAGGHFAATVALLANGADRKFSDPAESCTPASIAAKRGHFLVSHVLSGSSGLRLASLQGIALHPGAKECVVKFLSSRDAQAMAVASSFKTYRPII